MIGTGECSFCSPTLRDRVFDEVDEGAVARAVAMLRIPGRHAADAEPSASMVDR